MDEIARASRFLFVGAINSAVGYGVICAAKWLAHIGDIPANALGYGAGLVVSFALNKSWTFGYSGSAARALERFLLVFACAYVLNIATVLTLIRAFGLNAYFAQAVGIVPYTAFTYLASRGYAFRQ